MTILKTTAIAAACAILTAFDAAVAVPPGNPEVRVGADGTDRTSDI